MQLSILLTIAAAIAVNGIAIPADDTKPNGGPPPPANSCKYTCTGSGGPIDALNCVNILTGVPIVVPITVGSSKREEGVTPVTYCCKPDDTLLNLISCVDVASGASILLPVSLFH